MTLQERVNKNFNAIYAVHGECWHLLSKKVSISILNKSIRNIEDILVNFKIQVYAKTRRYEFDKTIS